MVINRTCIIAFVAILSGVALSAAADDRVAIPQVSDEPLAAPKANADAGMDIDHDHDNDAGVRKEDHQTAVLADPTISDFGRANALLNQAGSGANTASVFQQGNGNSSAAIQGGPDNYANQAQTGEVNAILLEQKGGNSRSVERQSGNSGHKTIIQNGNRSETSIEQVGVPN